MVEACPVGYVKVDECFCYKLLHQSLLLEGFPIEMVLDLGSPPVKDDDTPQSCRGEPGPAKGNTLRVSGFWILKLFYAVVRAKNRC